MARYPKVYDQAIIDGSPHLKRFIKSGTTKQAFTCSLCPGKDRQFESLLIHIESDAHGDKCKNSDGLKESLAYLKQKGFRSGKAQKGKGIEKETLIQEAILVEEVGENGWNAEKKDFEEEVDDIFLPDKNIQFQYEIAKFILKKDLPFSLTKDLVELIHRLAKNFGSDLLTCKANKNDISKFTLAIGQHLKQQHLKTLVNCPFSLAIDGGTTEGNEEYLGMNARYFSNDSDTKTTTKLIGLIPFTKGASGENILQMIEKFLFSGEEGEIRKKKLVGVSVDGAPNMLSSKEGGATNRLAKQIESLVVTYDLCHAMNLVIQKCLNSFPVEYKNIVTQISQTFAQSPIKAANLKAYFKKKKIQVLSVKRYIPTRWTSFIDCLDRILHLFTHIEGFFLERNSKKAQKKKKKTASEKQAKKDYFTPKNKLMLNLMLSLMKKLSYFIKAFEEDNIEITSLVKLIKRSYVIIGEYLYKINPPPGESPYETLTDILREGEDTIPATAAARSQEEFEAYFLKQNTEFNGLLNSIEEKERESVGKEFFKNAMKFFETAFRIMGTKLPAADSVLMNADALLLRDDTDIDKLRVLASHFEDILTTIKPDMKASDFSNEFERLAQERSELNHRIEQNRANPFSVWQQEHRSYPLTYELVKVLQILPYSTASVERLFSTMGNVKTAKRNRLASRKLECCLLVKQDLQLGNSSLTPEILKLYQALPEDLDSYQPEDEFIPSENQNLDENEHPDQESLNEKAPEANCEEQKMNTEEIESSHDIPNSQADQKRMFELFLQRLFDASKPSMLSQEKTINQRKRRPKEPIRPESLKKTKKVIKLMIKPLP